MDLTTFHAALLKLNKDKFQLNLEDDALEKLLILQDCNKIKLEFKGKKANIEIISKEVIEDYDPTQEETTSKEREQLRKLKTRFTDKELNEICEQYKKEGSKINLQKKYKIHLISLDLILKTYAGITETILKYSDEEMKKILELKKSGMSVYKIGKMYDEPDMYRRIKQYEARAEKALLKRK